jgi:diadenylate cyclase
METITNLISQLHWYDLLDILVVTYVVAWLYSWVKGTRAFKVLLGLGLLVLVFFWAQTLGLFLTGLVFGWLWQATVIFVIIIFAPEIRQVLERLNPLRIWSQTTKELPDYTYEIVDALEYFSQHRIGALLVFERSDSIRDHIRPGIRMGGEIHREILVSIFQHNSPTHDGAVWIRGERVEEVAVFLPISQADLPTQYGSRHRAAVGITELTDALVLVVSEERGEISVAEAGRLEKIKNIKELEQRLKEGLRPAVQPHAPTFREVFLKDWKIKLVALLLVTSTWFVLASQQAREQSFRIPVQYRDLPADASVISSSDRNVWVRLSGTRRALAAIDPGDLQLQVSVANAQPGATQIVRLDQEHLSAPPGVAVIHFQPQFLEIEVAENGIASPDQSRPAATRTAPDAGRPQRSGLPE